MTLITQVICVCTLASIFKAIPKWPIVSININNDDNLVIKLTAMSMSLRTVGGKSTLIFSTLNCEFVPGWIISL